MDATTPYLLGSRQLVLITDDCRGARG